MKKLITYLLVSHGSLHGLAFLLVVALSLFTPACGWANGWTSDPAVNTPICTAGNSQFEVRAISDGAGGTILTWGDLRNGRYEIFAQRLNSAGETLWTADGVDVCSATGSEHDPTLASDGAGGAIIVWVDYRNSTNSEGDIYAQKLNGSGVAQWASSGVPVCEVAGDQGEPQIVLDGFGGAVIAWMTSAIQHPRKIYAQRLSNSGAPQWVAEGVEIYASDKYTQDLKIVSDDLGGAVLTWIASQPTNPDVYAQRVSHSGEVLWLADGVAVCTATGNQLITQIVAAESGSVIITWRDMRGSSDGDIYAQRLSSVGTAQWAENGIPVCTALAKQDNCRLVSDGAGGAIITWTDFRDGTESDIYAQRVNSPGVPQWATDGVAVSAAPGRQYYPVPVADGFGGAVIGWMDYRNTGSSGIDMYAQRIDSLGIAQWTTNGVAVCTAEGNQYTAQLVADGQGGVFFAWDDNRVNSDIYAQRIMSTGELPGSAVSDWELFE